MRIKTLLSFLAGFTVSTIIMLLLIFIYLISTFDMVASESIEQVKNSTYIQFFVSIPVFLSALFFTLRLLKKGQKAKAIGVVIIPALFFLYMTALLIEYKIDFTKFNREVWVNSNIKPLGMSKTLYYDSSLIGQSKKDIIVLLGQPSAEYAKSYIDYRIEDNWVLTIYFQNDTSISQSLINELW